MTEKEKQEKTKELFVIGADIHPDSFTAAAYKGYNSVDNERVWLHVKVLISNWEKWLLRHVPQRSVIIMEAGCNSFEYAEQAEKLGYKPIVLDSARVGKLSKAYCKNDKEDAVKLAKIYFSGMIKEHVWRPDSGTRIRREILAAYRRAVKDSTRSKNRLKGFFTGHGIRLKKGTRLTLVAAEETIIGKSCWTEGQKKIIHAMFEDVRHAECQRKELGEHIACEVLSIPLMRELMRLCGIRIFCAYAIMAAVGDINRFESPKKLVAYLGLTPKSSQSGKNRKDGGLTHTGRREVKTYLIQAAQAILRSKNKSGEKLRKWGCSLIFRKNKNVAVAAVARKLVVAVWYLMRGFLPEILDITEDIQRKVKKIAEELGMPLIKAMGYKSPAEFIQEYTECLLLKT